MAASREFYGGGRGMLEGPRPGCSFDGLWFQCGETQIHLILEHEGSGPAGNLVPVEHRGARTHHFAFEVEDANACAKRLAAMGVPIAAGPKQRPDGAVQVFLCDPDGHVVELTSTGSP